MMRRAHLWLSLSMAIVPGVAIASSCQQWSPWPIQAVRALTSCSAPVIRQIGQLCTYHEWRCGLGSFEDWFDGWMRQRQAVLRVQRRWGQLILSGEHGDEAWALFWGIESAPSSGFAILVSRLRAYSR
jgi:hypothetical protein